MSDEGSNKNKTISFRVEEQVFEDLKDIDRSMSEFYRGITDQYFEEQFFREGVDKVLDGEQENFKEYSMSKIRKSAEEFAEEVAEDLDRPVDAADLTEPLVDYALNAAARYRTGTYNAVDGVREVDKPLGDAFEEATNRFPDQYWDEALE